VTYFCSIGSQILYVFETHGNKQQILHSVVSFGRGLHPW